ncbi:MAG: hypothetical protein LUP94_00390 [Candidatus Methanomethylicus sp.]|nr:hypothetical protein [Candidatus Methanomethylicus sp.]
MEHKEDKKAVIGHVGIEVSKLSISKKFYKILLGAIGFKTIMENEEGIGFSNQSFQVWISELPAPRVLRRPPTGEEFVIADHLAILVQDKGLVEAVEMEMAKEGYKPLFPCEEHPEFEQGYYAVSFCDPDNYVLEIYTRLNPKRF